MSVSEQALTLFRERFGEHPAPTLISTPGRLNLIGEHIDYHGLPVLPMAIQRGISIAFRARTDLYAYAISSGQYGKREFVLASALDPSPAGDWANYLKAGALAAQKHWNISCGFDAAIASDLPAAAGLSSSSSLLVAFTLSLLKVNEIQAELQELMEVLPEAEQFVGTRGGGMDHAAILASRTGCALLVRFVPFGLSHIPVPRNWAFLVADSLERAEKSGALRAEYNARRAAGARALQSIGLSSYHEALAAQTCGGPTKLQNETERDAFLHVTTEGRRVQHAVNAMRESDLTTFGALLNASHASLRDRLRVSTPAIDELVELALEAGAPGARLTGAGFGGCVLILCRASDQERVREHLIRHFYAKRAGFNPQTDLFLAQPSQGAL